VLQLFALHTRPTDDEQANQPGDSMSHKDDALSFLRLAAAGRAREAFDKQRRNRIRASQSVFR
jgi:hypothetical protein